LPGGNVKAEIGQLASSNRETASYLVADSFAGLLLAAFNNPNQGEPFTQPATKVYVKIGIFYATAALFVPVISHPVL